MELCFCWCYVSVLLCHSARNKQCKSYIQHVLTKRAYCEPIYREVKM
jgi:hypothetical protein